MKVKKNNKKELKKVQEEVKVEEVKEEKVVEEKPVEKKVQKDKKIQIKERSFDAEKNMQFSNWVSGKAFKVIDEDDKTYTFGTDAGIKLGVAKKEDCTEL